MTLSTPAPKNKERKNKGILHTFSLLKIRRRELAVLVGLTVLYGIFEGFGVSLLLPVLQYIESGPAALATTGGVFGDLLNGAGKLGIPITLSSLLLLAFIPILLRQVVYFLQSWYSAVVMRRAALRLRRSAFGALAHGDLSFIVSEGQGQLVSTLTQQVSRGSNAVMQFGQLVAAVVLLAVYVGLLLLLQAILALITVIAMLGISTLVRGSIKRARRYGLEVSKTGNETYAFIAERVAAIRLIKMRGQEDSETQKVFNVSQRFEQANVKVAISKAVVEVTVDPVLMLAVFIIIFVGVTYMHLSLASLGLFMFILLRLNVQSKSFNVSRQQLYAYIDSLELVFSTIRKAEASRHIRGGELPFVGLDDGIEFRHVGFHYNDEDGKTEDVLKDVDFRIPKGGLVAFVGRSGAGKSTLADLIPRLRDATEGEVVIDGHPITEYELISLRRRVGFMWQDAVMFNDTIFSNLVYGLSETPTDAQIATALHDAYCTDFIASMPQGLQTNIGDRGVRLSGGQRQRLALARVLLQDPDILILDEPTSALDSESEQYIQKALDDMRGTRTLVVIAHRLSTVQRADEILVLERGVIVERGTHDQLLNRDGAYRKLFELQIHS